MADITTKQKKYKLRKLLVDRVDLCKKGANQDAHIVLFKADADGELEKKGKQEMDELKKQLEDLQKAADAQKAELEKAKADLAKAQTDLAAEVAKSVELQKTADTAAAEVVELKKTSVAKTEEEQEAELLKSMPEAFRTKYAAQQADLKKSEAEKAELIAKAQEAEFKKSAGENLSNLLGDEAVKIGVMRSLAKLTDAERKPLVDMLKSANVVIGKSDLMQELGKSLDPTSTGTAEEKLNAIAKSFVEAKVAPDMGAALSKASKENPELYREYQVESRNKNKT